MLLYLCIIPIPPNKANDIAILSSVTVSIKDTIGTFKDTFFDIFVLMFNLNTFYNR